MILRNKVTLYHYQNSNITHIITTKLKMVNSNDKAQADQKVHGTRANVSYVLKTELDIVINTAVLKIQTSMVENLRPVNEALARLEANVKENSVKLAEQDNEITTLKTENAKLQEIVDELAARVTNLENAPNCDNQHPQASEDLAKELDKVKERLEERTNRQLRQTLVIKGVKELPQGETWEQTKELLASTIAKTVKTSYNNAYVMLNRVHRSRPSANPHKRGQRDIFANLFSWDNCERLVKDFRHVNVRGQSDVRVEFKYGPLTTNRRMQAMERRRTLKDSGDIVSGYVAYPARLMAKTRGSSDYRMLENFSLSPYKEYKPINTLVGDAPALVPVTVASADVHHEAVAIQHTGWSNTDLHLVIND